MQLLSLALLLTAASADFNGDLSQLSSAASELKGRVDNWSSQDGLFAALAIQGYFPTLSNAVAVVSQDASSIQDSEIQPSNIIPVATEVSALLASLTQKAGDFSAVGAGQIVSNDLQGIGAPAEGFVNGLISALANDCGKVDSLTSVLNGVEGSFSSAFAAYGVNQLSFDKPNC